MCLKGHWCEGRRRREESLISPHLRWTIPDLRIPLSRPSSIVHPSVNPALKIKNPSPNAKKLLKVNKGKLRVFGTLPGVPSKSAAHHHQQNVTCHYTGATCANSKFKIHHSKLSQFTPKNTRFMPFFCQRQFVNNSQRTLAIITSTLQRPNNPAAPKPASATLSRRRI